MTLPRARWTISARLSLLDCDFPTVDPANPAALTADEEKITAELVRSFAEHGWELGRRRLGYSSDDSEGYHDYMHFSYMGE